MLEDLVDSIPVEFIRLHWYPLPKDDGNSSPKDIVTLLLDLNFLDKRCLQKTVEVQLLL
jgi:hypothetical protein